MAETYTLDNFPSENFSKSGIYCYTCLPTKKVYIGQTYNIHRRFGEHLEALEEKTHCNIYFQRAYNKYGKEAFTFQILTFCNRSELDKYEKHFMDIYKSFKPSKGYNIQYFDENGKPTYNSNFSKIMKNSPNNGYKINQKIAKKIRKLYSLGYRPDYLYTKYNLDNRHLSNILSNKVWYDAKYTRPSNLPKLDPDEQELVKEMLRDGCSINDVIKHTPIKWHRLKCFLGTGNERTKVQYYLLNTCTGIYYNSFAEAAKTLNIPASRLYSWLIKHPHRNSTDFIIASNNKRSKPKKYTVLNTETGIYYESINEAAKTVGLTSRGLMIWLIHKPSLNKSNLILV